MGSSFPVPWARRSPGAYMAAVAMAWLRRWSISHFACSASSERPMKPPSLASMPEQARKKAAPPRRDRRKRGAGATNDRRRRRTVWKGQSSRPPAEHKRPSDHRWRKRPIEELVQFGGVGEGTIHLPAAASRSRVNDAVAALLAVFRQCGQGGGHAASNRNRAVGINRKNPIPHEIPAIRTDGLSAHP